jgi:hypothetical protein
MGTKLRNHHWPNLANCNTVRNERIEQVSDKKINGAIFECQRLGEALLENPTLKVFAAYRRALTHLATVLNSDIEMARAVMFEYQSQNLGVK